MTHNEANVKTIVFGEIEKKVQIVAICRFSFVYQCRRGVAVFLGELLFQRTIPAVSTWRGIMALPRISQNMESDLGTPLKEKEQGASVLEIVAQCELAWTRAEHQGDMAVLDDITRLLQLLLELKQLYAAFRHTDVIEGDGGVASLLQVNKNTIYNKLTHLGLKRTHFRRNHTLESLISMSAPCRALMENINTYCAVAEQIEASPRLTTSSPSFTSEIHEPLSGFARHVVASVFSTATNVMSRLTALVWEFFREREPIGHLAVFRQKLEEARWELRFGLPNHLFAEQEQYSSVAWIMVGLKVRLVEDAVVNAGMMINQLPLDMPQNEINSQKCVDVFLKVHRALITPVLNLQEALNAFSSEVINHSLVTTKNLPQRVGFDASVYNGFQELIESLKIASNEFGESDIDELIGRIDTLSWRLCEEAQLHHLEIGDADVAEIEYAASLINHFLDVEDEIINKLRLLQDSDTCTRSVLLRAGSVKDRCEKRLKDLEAILESRRKLKLAMRTICGSLEVNSVKS
ncbi:MAG: hypothetical protein U0941_08190 [Planctomycetaceae bacterium]